MFTNFLFIIYLVVFSWLFIKSKFIQQSQLPIYIVLGLFILKVVAGCVYGYIHYSSVYGLKTDTWKFYTESLPATDLLMQNPIRFLRYLFSNGYTTEGGYLSEQNNYWNDLKHNIMIALMSICNVFSGKNYYINCVFYNAFTMLGCIAFYRFCLYYFSTKAKWFILTALCIPSFLFWSSGFHKEGLLFSLISFTLYSGHQLIQSKAVVKHSFIIALSVLGILALRNYLLLFFIPFFAGWVFMQYYPKLKHWLSYTVIGVSIILLFFSNTHFTNITASTNNSFKQLGGNTTNYTDSLQPTATSFLHYTPTALNNAFLKPSPNQLSLTYIPSFIENSLLLTLLLFILFNYKKPATRFTNHFFLFFSFGTILFLGFSVPVTGAIIRYKAILLPFIVVALLPYIKVKWKQKLSY